MLDGVFQVLIVSGLFLLVAAVVVGTIVIVRRGRPSGSVGSATVVEPSIGSGSQSPHAGNTAQSPASPADLTSGSISTDDQAAERRRKALDELSELRAKAESVMSDAQAVRSEVADETRAQRAAL